jgi:hypothetical protein
MPLTPFKRFDSLKPHHLLVTGAIIALFGFTISNFWTIHLIKDRVVEIRDHVEAIRLGVDRALQNQREFMQQPPQ